MNALAQLRDPDPDWVELATVTPPAFDKSRSVPFNTGNSLSDLKWAIDPKTFSLGSDGIVRLVVIGTSTSGAVNIRYDGIHCAKREIKTYARASASGEWAMVNAPVWQEMLGSRSNAFALMLAKTALCDAGVPRSDIREILQLLTQKSSGPAR